MQNHGGVIVKTEHPMEQDDNRSSSSVTSHEQERIRQLEQAQENMRQQMAQMQQLLSASNPLISGDSSYPCPNFGQLPFKREVNGNSFASSDEAASLNNNNHNKNNENPSSPASLDKEKLWNLYLAGKVSLDGVRDVKSDAKSNVAPDSDIEGIALEEEEEEEEEEEAAAAAPADAEDPSRQGFLSTDWDLVFDDGKIAAILCEPCRLSGKEPIPIRSDTLDKIKSLGEQHLVFRHNYAPKGYPMQVGPRPIQCKICKSFFRVEKLLERHAKACVAPKDEPGTTTTAVAAAAASVVPCKVELFRSREVEDVAKKRKLSFGSVDSSEKRRYKARGKVETEPVANKDEDNFASPQPSSSPPPPPPPPPAATPKSASSTSVDVAGKSSKKVKEEKNSCKSDDCSSIKAYFSATAKPAKPRVSSSPSAEKNGKKNKVKKEVEDSPPAMEDEAPSHDKGVGGGADDDEERAQLPTKLVTLGDRWHEGEKYEGGFACPLCKTRPLSRPIFIEDHVAASHFKQKRYICTICRKKHEEEEDEEEKKKVQFAWSHKSTLNEHLQKNHSLQFARQEKLGFKLMEIEPLLPDAVNAMRLFFKIYPKKGEKTKPKYAPKKPNTSDSNQKKSKCPECDQKFYTQEERTLIDHIMWRHRNAPRYHCAHCKDDTGFGMVAGFEDHCKKEHGCDKNDYVSMLLMRVDKVPEELARQYYIDDNDYQDLHKGKEIISDDEEDMPDKKEEVASKIPDMKIGFRRKEMFFICRNDKCDWTLSSRELFLVDKINKHIKTH